MQELLTGSSADGSFTMYQNTSTNTSDDSRELRDLNNYMPLEDSLGDDSDILPTPSTDGTGNNKHPSNYTRSGIKRSRGNTSTLPTKKATKNKNCLVESNDEITATMKSLRDTHVRIIFD